MISAAGAGVPAVEHELFRGQAAQVRFLVQRRRVLDQFIPACGRVEIHFNHAGIGRDFDHVDARIVRRGIPFDEHGHPQVGGRILDRRDQAKIILEVALRRHEHAQDAVARFRAQRRSNRPRRRLAWRRRQIEHHGSPARPLPCRSHFQGLLHEPLRGLIFGNFFRIALPSSQGGAVGQWPADRHRILLDDVMNFGRVHPGNGIERQAETHGRVAGNQVHSLRPEEPCAGHPIAAPVGVVFAPQGQRVANDLIQASFEHARKARAIFRIFQLVFEWIDVDREAPLLPQVIPGVFIAGQRVLRVHAQSLARLRIKARASALVSLPEVFSLAMSAGSRQIGSPSLRQ